MELTGSAEYSVQPHFDIPNLTDATESKILAFLELRAGWHFGEGIGFRNEEVNAALELNRAALDNAFVSRNAFRGTNGDITFCVYQNKNYLEFSVAQDGGIDFCREFDNNEVEERLGLTIDEAKQKIAELGEEVCRLSEFSTPTTMIMTPTNSASRALCSRSVATKVVLA